jgi:hypothetical protein
MVNGNAPVLSPAMKNLDMSLLVQFHTCCGCPEPQKCFDWEFHAVFKVDERGVIVEKTAW